MNLLWILAVPSAAGGGSNPPVELLWAAQGVTLLVTVVTGWFALRSKKSEVTSTRQTEFDKRVDAELDDQRSQTKQWQEAWADEHRLRLRYEGFLLRNGIDLDSGRREVVEQ